jgi:hypothetical protein
VSAQRAFDHELLRQLVQDNPGWTNYRLAQELTKDNEARGLGAVSEETVRRNLSRFGEDWGIRQRADTRDALHPPGVVLAPGTSGRMSLPLRYLRELRRENAGDRPDPGNPGDAGAVRARRQAVAWAAKQRAGRIVVDLTLDGEVITRPARAEEINGKGELISLMAWQVPGWRGKNVL